ncbi:MAG: hypothetical protein GXO77_13640 [Calditrichaeota bacterium]|nr:hypothetical protein [Calditrichota bacterium]
MNLPKIDSTLKTIVKPEQKPTTDKEDKKLRESAKQLEGLFLTFMLKAMEKTIPKFGDKKQSSNMVSMMYSTVMGEDLAEKGGIGLADFIYRNMKGHENGDLKIPTQMWVDLIPDKLISGRKND